ncbi:MULTISPECIES: hypothetical protein [unclassified Paraburkholderia]|uniref:hypothetical protein n=1 Tax=unclassified Paraburkholderia TaxID=2615204 RepID=UPI002AB2F2AB|nr:MULTISPECIES: hypothetical protein [unclassified Paraburkholderia]
MFWNVFALRNLARKLARTKAQSKKINSSGYNVPFETRNVCRQQSKAAPYRVCLGRGTTPPRVSAV